MKLSPHVCFILVLILKHEFETAIVNELSEFEPLKFHCKRTIVLQGSKPTFDSLFILQTLRPNCFTEYVVMGLVEVFVSSANF